MTHLQRSFLYWAALDKRRPVLVLSPNVRNERASDVIVIPCPTIVRPAPTHVVLRRKEGGIRDTSVLKCEQITTLHQSDVHPDALGGSLSLARLIEVEWAVLGAIGIPIPLAGNR